MHWRQVQKRAGVNYILPDSVIGVESRSGTRMACEIIKHLSGSGCSIMHSRPTPDSIVVATTHGPTARFLGSIVSTFVNLRERHLALIMREKKEAPDA